MKQKIALVLSGGGARGIAHIGVVEELEKQNFEITSIAGTSMGALVGGIYAIGKLAELKDWLYTLDKMKVLELIDFTLSSHGIVKGDKVLNTMKAFIADKNIEDLRIQFSATATDLLNKKEVVFTKGSVYDAIRASIAIPSVITPIEKKGSILVDGGVLNNIPISNIHRNKGDKLIAVNVNANIPVYKPRLSKKASEIEKNKQLKKLEVFQEYLSKFHLPHKKENHWGYFTLMSKTINLMMSQMSQMSLQYHKPDLLIEVSRDSSNTYDFYKAQELVEIGRHAAKKALKGFNKL